ncbi:MAG TPA: tetratricopeptide repeat protein [Thiobacillus sp.]|nr:MAG: co-chaperone YbbN [Hydrogenophilales bacterium 28-61-11]OYZ56895.1 MAG: co-chaperone YbbN [Hydrogenophilales bacterium 16-61-112]OZA47928.1 MAG: co-chaperone YbbN [Hydrogenophilales bacterium 17-61-76]HQT30972.1 tetratricopeptide repeat protein [Thiobacillus sp.]HQT69071.1 tetratricopeptide repeat protein [Thiobacillus sp.]
MSLSPHVFDARADTFNRLVLENSHKGPVLVHFWTPKAAPCFILMPRLVKLAAEYGGKFLLVMLNADELPELARRFSVNSVPTVKFFWRGEVAHTIHGADPDSSFREVLDRFIAGDANRAHALGVAAWQSGKVEQARMLLANAAMAEPDNLAIPRDLAKLLWSDGDSEQALKLLDSLPPEARMEPEIARLHAHLNLAETARHAPPLKAIDAQLAQHADDLAAHYQRAAVLLARDDFEGAMTELLFITRTDRSYRHDIGRTSLLALFDLLGSAHPLTRQFRQALSESLH